MTKLNTAQICSISIYKKAESRSYIYKEAKKSFWGNTKEGFYDYWVYGEGGPYTPEDIEKKSGKEQYCEGKKVFYKPYIVIRMSDQRTRTKFFQTERELKEYLKQPEIAGLQLIEL